MFLNRIEFTLCRKNLHSIAVPFAAEIFLAELLDHTRGRISYYCGVLVDLVEHHEVYTLISRPSECDDIRSGYFWKMLKVPFHRHDIEATFSGSKQKVKYIVVEFDPEKRADVPQTQPKAMVTSDGGKCR